MLKNLTLLYSILFGVVGNSYAADAASNSQPNPIIGMVPLFVVMALFYFLIVKPQRKKQQEVENMLATIRIGNKVSISSGIIGQITAINEEEGTVTIKTCGNTELLVYKKAVVELISNDKNSNNLTSKSGKKGK